MTRQRKRWIIRTLQSSALLGVALANSGCVMELVSIPFDVARHTAIESARIPIDAAEIAAKGIIKAVPKQ